MSSELIHRFYTAFQDRDAFRMKACYHPEATFKDEVFELNGREEIGKMWSMLTERAEDFELTFSNIQIYRNTGTADWEASYRFSKTGRMVHNQIYASFQFQDDLIFFHHDVFDFWKWSQMALGLPGYLLGWSPFLQNRVKQEARMSLDSYKQS